MAKGKSSGLKNAPATTGNKSGKGRANNPPAKAAAVKSVPVKSAPVKTGSSKKGK